MARFTFYLYMFLLGYSSLLPFELNTSEVFKVYYGPPSQTDVVSNLALYFVIPFLAALGSFRIFSSVLPGIVIFSFFVEVLQGLVFTRVTSIIDFALNIIGYILGAAVVTAFYPTAFRFYKNKVLPNFRKVVNLIEDRLTLNRIGVLNSILLLWGLVVLQVYCTPFPTPSAFNTRNFKEGLDLFLGLPFVLAQSSDYIVSLTVILIDLVVFAIPGILIALLLRYNSSDTRVVYLGLVIGVGLGVEVLQMVMINRASDITDVIVYSLGVLGAYSFVNTQLRLVDKLVFLRK